MNDNDETLFQSMQQTDNASFNQGVFESTHHMVHTLNENDKEEMNVQSHHDFIMANEKNEAFVETDTHFRNIKESNVPLLNLMFNCSFKSMNFQKRKQNSEGG